MEADALVYMQAQDNSGGVGSEQQLLQITTIPISIEIKVTNAKYQYPEGKDRQPKVNITNTQGGYVMKADPIKVNIDTYEARKSLATVI